MFISPDEKLKICSGCGEIFDANVALEVVHHAQAEHVALLPSRRNWRLETATSMRARAG
jgi:hypothetical protein